MNELGSLINRIRGRLAAEGIPFVIGGSFALAALGHPRFTQDIDVMVMVQDADRLPSTFAGSEFILINEITFQDADSGIYIDLYPVSDEAQQEAFRRARPVSLHGAAPVSVLDPEGLVLMLLREATAGDPRKRSLRLRDIELLAADEEIDWAWVEQKASSVGYGEAFAEVHKSRRTDTTVDDTDT